MESQDTKVVGLAKDNLTNEDAFFFWAKSFPTKYCVPFKEFQTNFKAWIKLYKDKTLTNEKFLQIMQMVKSKMEDENDDITAKDINTFFENLPADMDWNNLNTAEAHVK